MINLIFAATTSSGSGKHEVPPSLRHSPVRTLPSEAGSMLLPLPLLMLLRALSQMILRLLFKQGGSAPTGWRLKQAGGKSLLLVPC